MENVNNTRIMSFKCMNKIGKVDYFGVITVQPDSLVFKFTNDNNEITKIYNIDEYEAHRKHPKLLLLQFRFKIIGNVTLCFKSRDTGEPEMDSLNSFLKAFLDAFNNYQNHKIENKNLNVGKNVEPSSTQDMKELSYTIDHVASEVKHIHPMNETPQISEIPQISETPQMSKTSQMSETTQIYQTPQTFVTSQIYQTPQTLETSQIYQTPQTFETSQIYQTPQICESHQTLQTCQIPHIPQISSNTIDDMKLDEFLKLDILKQNEINKKQTNISDEEYTQDKLKNKSILKTQKTNLIYDESAMKAKIELLKNNSVIKNLYQCLVQNNNLSENQFWEYYNNEVIDYAESIKDTQNDDLFLYKAPEEEYVVDEMNSLRAISKINYSTKHINQILNEQPTIKELYVNLVPTKVTEQEFWSRFFRSKYFYQLTGRNVQPTADISFFPNYDANTTFKIPDASTVQSFVEPTVDLISSEGLTRSINDMKKNFGYVDTHSNDSPLVTLIERVNRFSLKSLLQSEDEINEHQHYSPSLILDQSTKRNNYFRSITHIDDLMKIPTEHVNIFTLKDNIDLKSNLIDPKVYEYKSNLVNRLKNFNHIKQSESIDPKCAKFLFLMNTKLIQKSIQQSEDRTVNNSLASESNKILINKVTEDQIKLHELLRFFWNSQFDKKDRYQKILWGIQNMLEDINIFLNKSHSMKNQFPVVNPRALYQPLIQAAKTALNKYDTLTKTM